MRRLFWVWALAVALALAPVAASAGGIRVRIDNRGGHDSQGVGRGDPDGAVGNPTKDDTILRTNLSNLVIAPFYKLGPYILVQLRNNVFIVIPTTRHHHGK